MQGSRPNLDKGSDSDAIVIERVQEDRSIDKRSGKAKNVDYSFCCPSTGWRVAEKISIP